MSDPDFEALKRTEAPKASNAAKARAHDAAMDAFDQAAQKKSAALKGSHAGDRHTTASPSWAWRTIMQNRLAFGGAAACLVAVPLAAIIVAQDGLGPLSGDRGTLRQTAREDEAAKARVEALPRDQTVAEAAKPAEPLAPPPSPSPVQSASPKLERAPGGALPSQARSLDRQASGVGAPSPSDQAYAPESGRDRFADGPANSVKVTAQEPVSTFSIDADTASYSWVRRALMQGRTPAPEEVRVEELINYFPYDYEAPTDASVPFRPTVAVYPTPWNRDTRIVHIGIKGFEAPASVRPKANLVFLVDVSGSMGSSDKLPLVKASLKLLLDQLKSDDSVALVTYAGAAGVALEPTKVSDRDAIVSAIDRMGAGGSTAGAAGIEEAYRLAKKSFDPKGINRVLLATDGDFNVGTSDDDGLTRLVERERQSGVFLSVLGFGQGNYNDAMMQKLAQNGNGTAAYIDQLEEAQKVLSEEATRTLFPIAKDVKIQVEFNPQTVSEYRLIGYETRILKREDFRDDRVDAGEIGSGAAVTALYEIVPAGSPARLTEDLRYGAPTKPAAEASSAEEYGFLKLRYKLPNEAESRPVNLPINREKAAGKFADESADVRFAAAVAAFGQKLKGDRRLAGMTWDEIATIASGARGEDRWGYRAGFVRLIGLAKAVKRD